MQRDDLGRKLKDRRRDLQEEEEERERAGEASLIESAAEIREEIERIEDDISQIDKHLNSAGSRLFSKILGPPQN